MRIRSIKPEYWRSDDITSLPLEDRLLFIGLWSYVDDNGVGRDELADILGDLFSRDWLAEPQETVARVSRGLSNLSETGLIRRYSIDGKRFLHISAWDRHQRVDKPAKPRYPEPDPHDSAIPETPATSSRDSRDILAPGAGEQGNRGAGEQGAEEQELLVAPAALVPVDPGPTFDDFWSVYPRRADKPAAKRAWDKATKRARPDVILAAAARYRDDPNRVDQFTKHPGPWLNAEAWNDPPLPDRGGGRPESSFDRVLRQNQEAAAELAREEEAHGRQGSPRAAITMGR